MMYNNKLVACIKAAGKVLRESKDADNNTSCYIPFGSEYALSLKNLNTVRAKLKISIDGTDVMDGNTLILRPNQTLDLERSIKNGNLNLGNKFKFIERTAKVEGARGIGGEDGLVRIEFAFERPVVRHRYDSCFYSADIGVRSKGFAPQTSTTMDYLEQEQRREVSDEFFETYASMDTGPTTKTMGGIGGSSAGAAAASSPAPKKGGLKRSAKLTKSATVHDKINQRAEIQKNDAGITVAGALSEQQFHHTDDFDVESTSYVIVLKLLGETEEGAQVVAPVTVKTKKRCVTCDTVNKAGNKFCSDCGTSLVVV